MLCLSHALFKKYKRRYVNLHLFERGQQNSRRFFLGEQSGDMKIPPLTEDKLFPVLEMELKFLYDALFTKSSSTAYSGVVMRLVNTIIFGVAGFIIFNELGKKHEFFDGALSTQRTVTYIAVGVGLLVEFSQLLMTIASDWTLVWLICSNIRLEHKEKPNSIQRWAPKFMKLIIRILSCIREKSGRRYWKREIRQYCIVDACSQISPFIWKWSGYFHVRDLIIRWYIETSPVEDDFQKFIVEQVKEKCSPEIDIDTCTKNLKSWFSTLVRENRDTGVFSISNTDQEHLILYWHVATTICEMEYSMDDSDNEDGKRYFNTSKKLSRYCAYLLVSRPKLLPLHPDVGKMVYMELHKDLVDYSKSKKTLKDFARNPHEFNGSVFHSGVKLANELIEIGRENKHGLWEFIARHWAAVLIFNAKGARTTIHAEYLAVGGEFLTHLWVLIGNMACGDQY